MALDLTTMASINANNNNNNNSKDSELSQNQVNCSQIILIPPSASPPVVMSHEKCNDDQQIMIKEESCSNASYYSSDQKSASCISTSGDVLISSSSTVMHNGVEGHTNATSGHQSDVTGEGQILSLSNTNLPSATSYSSQMAHANHINRFGRNFVNGRPLPDDLRLEILRMSESGVRPCEISRELQISHGCVSKILHRFRKTGSISPGCIGGSKPKVTTIEVIDCVKRFKKEKPHVYAWEIRERLISDGICDESKAPSVSSINRIVRNKVNSSVLCSSKHECDSNLDGGNTLAYDTGNIVKPDDPMCTQSTYVPVECNNVVGSTLLTSTSNASPSLVPIIGNNSNIVGTSVPSIPLDDVNKYANGNVVMALQQLLNQHLQQNVATVPSLIFPTNQGSSLQTFVNNSAIGNILAAAAAASSNSQSNLVSQAANTSLGNNNKSNIANVLTNTSSVFTDRLSIGDCHILEDQCKSTFHVIKYVGGNRWTFLTNVHTQDPNNLASKLFSANNNNSTTNITNLNAGASQELNMGPSATTNTAEALQALIKAACSNTNTSNNNLGH